MSRALYYDALVVSFSLVKDAKPSIPSKGINQVLNSRQGVSVWYGLPIEEAINQHISAMSHPFFEHRLLGKGTYILQSTL